MPLLRPDEKNIAVVVNPVAGSGRGETVGRKVVAYLIQQDIKHTLFIDPWPADFQEFTDVWLVGGDGTANGFFNRYPELQLPVTLFMGGSGNDLHRAMHGNRTFEEILEVGLHQAARRMDAGVCNNRIFLNALGIGFDGSVARLTLPTRRWRGVRSYFYYIIRQVFCYRSVSYQLQADDYSFDGKLFMINFMNGEFQGGGYQVTPGAKLDDGLFQLLVIRPISIIKRLRYLLLVLKGAHLKLDVVDYKAVTTLRITSNALMEAHIDGEVITGYAFTVKVLPGKFLFRY